MQQTGDQSEQCCMQRPTPAAVTAMLKPEAARQQVHRSGQGGLTTRSQNRTAKSSAAKVYEQVTNASSLPQVISRHRNVKSSARDL